MNWSWQFVLLWLPWNIAAAFVVASWISRHKLAPRPPAIDPSDRP